MPYKQQRKDWVLLGLLILFFAGFIYILTLSLWCILFGPIYGLVALFISLWIATGKMPDLPKRPAKETGTIFSTTVLTTGNERKSCKVIVREAEILVTARGIPDIHIAMERIDGLLFKDESVPNWSMAGFGIDYTDHGSARLMFFDDGICPVYKSKRAVDAILKAHQAYFKGCDVPALPYVDVTPNKGDSVIHRYKQV